MDQQWGFEEGEWEYESDRGQSTPQPTTTPTQRARGALTPTSLSQWK